MDDLSMVESVIDMLACRWERNFKGSENIKNEDLLDIEESFLVRYTDNDRDKVKVILLQLLSTYDEAIQKEMKTD